jgi:hypothetical protein
MAATAADAAPTSSQMRSSHARRERAKWAEVVKDLVRD